MRDHSMVVAQHWSGALSGSTSALAGVLKGSASADS